MQRDALLSGSPGRDTSERLGKSREIGGGLRQSIDLLALL
jgi:hypothetical protein